jgi:hypothetical protein
MTGADAPLDEKVMALRDTFERARLPFAFGGAIALAYYAEPRATMDIDMNVFVQPDSFDAVAKVLGELDITATSAERRTAQRDGQVRLRWGITPIDLFFAYDAFHYHAAARIRVVPFGTGHTIPVLAPEDLLVCKAVFDRRKDWLDIEQMLLLTSGELDLEDVRRWLTAIVGTGDARAERFEQAVREVLGYA